MAVPAEGIRRLARFLDAKQMSHRNGSVTILTPQEKQRGPTLVFSQVTPAVQIVNVDTPDGRKARLIEPSVGVIGDEGTEGEPTAMVLEDVVNTRVKIARDHTTEIQWDSAQ